MGGEANKKILLFLEGACAALILWSDTFTRIVRTKTDAVINMFTRVFVEMSHVSGCTYSLRQSVHPNKSALLGFEAKISKDRKWRNCPYWIPVLPRPSRLRKLASPPGAGTRQSIRVHLYVLFDAQSTLTIHWQVGLDERLASLSVHNSNTRM
jgi:hypothetical protein